MSSYRKCSGAFSHVVTFLRGVEFAQLSWRSGPSFIQQISVTTEQTPVLGSVYVFISSNNTAVTIYLCLFPVTNKVLEATVHILIWLWRSVSVHTVRGQVKLSWGSVKRESIEKCSKYSTADVIGKITFIQCNFEECSGKSGWQRKCQRIVTTRRVYTLPFVLLFHVRPPPSPSPPPLLIPAFIPSPLLNLSLPSGLHFYSSHVDHTVSHSGWQLFTQCRAIFKAGLPFEREKALKIPEPIWKTHIHTGYLCF